jgi:hypothetical protein
MTGALLLTLIPWCLHLFFARKFFLLFILLDHIFRVCDSSLLGQMIPEISPIDLISLPKVPAHRKFGQESGARHTS